jgi:hypothetical protein
MPVEVNRRDVEREARQGAMAQSGGYPIGVSVIYVQLVLKLRRRA